MFGCFWPFSYFPGDVVDVWVGGGGAKLRLKIIAAQLNLKLGLSLA